VWTNLIKQRPAAKLTIDLKFLAVFSHRSATRLNRLSRPTPCSMRALALSRVRAKKAGLSFSLALCGMTGAMPRTLAASRLALLA
jgi:hypothetical protein